MRFQAFYGPSDSSLIGEWGVGGGGKRGLTCGGFERVPECARESSYLQWLGVLIECPSFDVEVSFYRRTA